VVSAKVGSDGVIRFSGTAYTRGEDAPGLRREYELPERQRDLFRDRLAEIFPRVRVEDVRVNGANDLEHDVHVEFRGALETFAGGDTILLPASWMPRAYVQNLAAPAARSQDLILPAPWTTEEEIRFALPPGASVATLPRDIYVETSFGSASLRYQRRGDELLISTSVRFTETRISPAEYAGFREFCAEVESAFRKEIKVVLGR
jgi:hypothetical protein